MSSETEPTPFDSRLVALGYKHLRPTLRCRRVGTTLVITESWSSRLMMAALGVFAGVLVPAMLVQKAAEHHWNLGELPLSFWFIGPILLFMSVAGWLQLFQSIAMNLRWVIDSEARTLGLYSYRRGPATAAVSLDRVIEVLVTEFYWRRTGSEKNRTYYRTPPRAVEKPVTAGYIRSYEVSARLDKGDEVPIGESTDVEVVRRIAAYLGDAACVQVVEGELGEL